MEVTFVKIQNNRCDLPSVLRRTDSMPNVQPKCSLFRCKTTKSNW